MEHKFNISDVIVLKSGTPPMTIINERLGDDPKHG